MSDSVLKPMQIDFSPEFAKAIRNYKNCENLSDTHIGLIAVFLRAINTPHYRCHIKFERMEVRPNYLVFTWRYDELATFDYRELTQIVFYAHQYSVRIGISALANGYFKISLAQREPFSLEAYKEKRSFHYHPSLEQALNSQYQTQWLQDQKKAYAENIKIEPNAFCIVGEEELGATDNIKSAIDCLDVLDVIEVKQAIFLPNNIFVVPTGNGNYEKFDTLEAAQAFVDQQKESEGA